MVVLISATLAFSYSETDDKATALRLLPVYSRDVAGTHFAYPRVTDRLR